MIDIVINSVRRKGEEGEDIQQAEAKAETRREDSVHSEIIGITGTYTSIVNKYQEYIKSIDLGYNNVPKLRNPLSPEPSGQTRRVPPRVPTSGGGVFSLPTTILP